VNSLHPCRNAALSASDHGDGVEDAHRHTPDRGRSSGEDRFFADGVAEIATWCAKNPRPPPHRHGFAQALSVGGGEVLESPATKMPKPGRSGSWTLPAQARRRPASGPGRRSPIPHNRTGNRTGTTAGVGPNLERLGSAPQGPHQADAHGDGEQAHPPGEWRSSVRHMSGACGGTPPAGAVAAADGDTAPAGGPTAPAVGATAPGLGVVGTGEGLAEPPLGAGVDGEGTPRLGPDGWWLERTTSKVTPRTRSTAMIAATGRMDWAAAPPRRAMPASCLSSCGSECSKAKLHPCGYSSKLQPRAFCSRVAVRC
jgi:hypothetical protein